MGSRVHNVFIKEITFLLLICQAVCVKYILLAESHVLYIKRLLAPLPTLYRI